MKTLLRITLDKVKEFFLKKTNPALRIAFSIPSHLTTLERIKLRELSQSHRSVAEIGSYIGASACCFGPTALKNHEKKIICIDTWNNDAMSEGNRDTWAEFQKNAMPFAQHIIPVRGLSTEVVDQVAKITTTVDLLFIDGDHSYEGVKADWESYKKFLKPGSTVIFHDYGWAEGVKKVVHEDVMPLVASWDSLPNMWWGTLTKQP